jgi:hypothetical protein
MKRGDVIRALREMFGQPAGSIFYAIETLGISFIAYNSVRPGGGVVSLSTEGDLWERVPHDFKTMQDAVAEIRRTLRD